MVNRAGATGVRIITEVAKTAGELFVFLRTPNWCAPLRNGALSAELISAFIAGKIRQRVKGPAIAKKPIPANHGFGTKRVPMDSGYYEVYNQPNVHPVDILEAPIEDITPKGVKTTDRECEQ